MPVDNNIDAVRVDEILFNGSCDGVALDGKLQFDNGGDVVYSDGN